MDAWGPTVFTKAGLQNEHFHHHLTWDFCPLSHLFSLFAQFIGITWLQMGARNFVLVHRPVICIDVALSTYRLHGIFWNTESGFYGPQTIITTPDDRAEISLCWKIPVRSIHLPRLCIMYFEALYTTLHTIFFYK